MFKRPFSQQRFSKSGRSRACLIGRLHLTLTSVWIYSFLELGTHRAYNFSVEVSSSAKKYFAGPDLIDLRTNYGRYLLPAEWQTRKCGC